MAVGVVAEYVLSDRAWCDVRERRLSNEIAPRCFGHGSARGEGIRVEGVLVARVVWRVVFCCFQLSRGARRTTG